MTQFLKQRLMLLWRQLYLSAGPKTILLYVQRQQNNLRSRRRTEILYNNSVLPLARGARRPEYEEKLPPSHDFYGSAKGPFTYDVCNEGEGGWGKGR